MTYKNFSNQNDEIILNTNDKTNQKRIGLDIF